MTERKIRNMEDFSEVSGISRPTLSKYFNAPDSVRQSTRDRIERALDIYNFRPNLFAINQNRKATRAIGIVVPHLADPFFAEIIRQLETSCIAAGYWAVVLSSHGDPMLERKALEMLRSLKPAGVILAPLGWQSDQDALHEFIAETPTVTFDTPISAAQDFVGTDNAQTIGIMVDYLCRSGTAPCFLEMPPVNVNAIERRDAYVAAMEASGEVPQILTMPVQGWGFEAYGYQEGKRLIAEHALPSSTVLCANDRLAIGLLSACWEMGQRVGRGPATALRIAGHDDHPQARYTAPSLTTVMQDYTGIAAHCMDLLFSRIEAGADLGAPRQVRLEGKLILRGSA